MPSYKCKHDKYKTFCKECGGGGRCPHDRQRSQCVICKPEPCFNQMRHNAKRRGKFFSLTLEEYKTLVSQCCEYCKQTPEEANGMGIDRVENHEGYVGSNCVPCCEVCNRMKTDFSFTEFVAHIKLIARKNAGSN